MKYSLPEPNVQLIVPLWLALSMTLPAFTVSIASKAMLSETRPVVTPLASTVVTLGATVLVRSKSLTVNVPLLLSVLLVSLRLAAALSLPTSVIAGASCVPVMVITTVLSAVLTGLLLSLARTV